jgi:hypothetical protein
MFYAAVVMLFALLAPFWLASSCALAQPAASAESSAVAQGSKIHAAVFDFELIDTSLEGEKQGPKPAEQARLALLGRALREKLAASSLYESVDITPVEAEARGKNLQNCGDCDVKMARELGADVAITGTVQKVSNLILNINLYIRDARTGRSIEAMSVDIRSNTDESWMHGLDWLVRNKLLAAPRDRR